MLSIYQDKSGIIWFGTNGGGICKVDERSSQFEEVRNSVGKPGVPREPIWGMMKDSEGVLWVGSKGSQYLYYSKDGQDFLKIKIPLGSLRNAWFKNGVRALYQTPDGTRWFSTQIGLFKLLGTFGNYEIQRIELKEVGKARTISQRQISSMYQDSDGYFWIGKQQDGLRKSVKPGLPDKQVFNTYGYGEGKDELKSNRVSTFLEDGAGNMWIGTYSGLHKYQAASDGFLSFSKKQGDIQSLSSDIVICLHQDRQGNLWVGTPNGLNLAIPQGDSLIFKCFQEKDGLPNNYIQSILEDDHGNLWLSTNKGISKFDVSDGVFYNYDVTDGLQSNAFMEGQRSKMLPACCISEEFMALLTFIQIPFKAIPVPSRISHRPESLE